MSPVVSYNLTVKKYLMTLILLILSAAGCAEAPQAVPTPSSIPLFAETAVPEVIPVPPQAILTSPPAAAPSLTPTFTASPTPTQTPTPGISGPVDFPAGVNPLTGLVVADPALLSLAPGLISISNAPVTTRPQSGLSYAARVYEFYLGQGDTRFLAVFYGGLPPLAAPDGTQVELGPLRSGRLPYETLRNFYNGYLVFASASDVVLAQLRDYQIVQNPNITDINGASIPVTRMLELGRDMFASLGRPNLDGQSFDPQPPDGGKPADKLWMAFHYYSQVFWKYDSQLGAYTRWQDNGPGTPLRQFTDRLNDQPLAYENVVVLFTNYQRYTETYFNIDLKYVYRWPALLFRDGKMYKIYWTTRSEAYEKKTGKLRQPRFIDYEGQPFPLKPGQTWVEIAQLGNSVYETVDSQDYSRLRGSLSPGSGVWAVFFIPPEILPEKK
jgi:hypothetical protein